MRMKYDAFLAAILREMRPVGRAHHQAGMLRHLLPLTPAEVTLADLAVGWQALARPQSQDEPSAVSSRREVCAELAAIATSEVGAASAPGQLAGAVRAWQAWVDECQQSADPRLVVVGKIFDRELVELRAAL